MPKKVLALHVFAAILLFFTLGVTSSYAAAALRMVTNSCQLITGTNPLTCATDQIVTGLGRVGGVATGNLRLNCCSYTYGGAAMARSASCTDVPYATNTDAVCPTDMYAVGVNLNATLKNPVSVHCCSYTANGSPVSFSNQTANVTYSNQASLSCAANYLIYGLGDTNVPDGNVDKMMCKANLCGDGTVQAPEQCDDGNTNDSDYCSNTCTINQVGGGSCKFYISGNYLGVSNACTGDRGIFSSMGLINGGTYTNTGVAANQFGNPSLDINDANFLMINSYSTDPNSYDNVNFTTNITNKISNFLQAGKHILLITDGAETAVRYTGGTNTLLAQLGLVAQGNSGVGFVTLAQTPQTLPEFAGLTQMWLSTASQIATRGAFGHTFTFPPGGFTATCQYKVSGGAQSGWCVWEHVAFTNNASIDIISSGGSISGCVGGSISVSGLIAHAYATYGCEAPPATTGTIQARAVAVSSSAATCADVRASTNYLDGTVFNFSSPTGQPSQTQSSGTHYASWSNMTAAQNYTISPTAPSGYVPQSFCWDDDSGTPPTSGDNQSTATLKAGATLTFLTGFSQQTPWMQVVGGGLNGGGGGISVNLPAGQYLATKESGITQNSPVVSYGTTMSLGSGSVSSDGYVVQDAQQAVSSGFSYYNYYNNVFGTKTALSGNTVSSNPVPALGTVGVYTAPGAGNLTVTGTWNITSGQSEVIFVPGNLTISTNVTVSAGGFIAFIVKGTVTVSDTVGYASPVANPDKVTQANVSGVYISDGQFITLPTAGSPDRQLIIAGTVVANGYSLGRDLESNNLSPSEMFMFRPDLWTNAPNQLKEVDVTWTEIAP